MDCFEYQTELDIYTQAVAASIAFNAPDRVARLRPRRDAVIALEDVHPMLRPVRKSRG